MKNGTTDDPTRDSGRRSPEDTKREIVEAACRFLWERPFRELTVVDLMDRTSVGRSSFYVHFRDRYELAAELLGSVDRELSSATEALRSTGPGAGMLKDTLDGVVAVWVRRGPVIRAISEGSAQDSRLEQLYRWDFIQRSIDRVTDVVLHAERDGWAVPDLDPAEIGSLLGLMVERYLCDRLGRHPQADPAQVSELLATTVERILGGPRR